MPVAIQIIRSEIGGDVFVSIEQLSRLEDLPPIEGSPPYKGLSYFTQADEHLFFGRNALKQELVEQVTKERFVAIVGASGSGKSSVVRAGALPELGRRGWSIRIITPTAHPLAELARAFYPHDETTRRTFCQSLSQDIQTLHRYYLPSTGRTLLVVDQFEELFTRSEEGAQGRSEQQVFVDNLLFALEAENELTVVIVLRSDFYEGCTSFAGLFPLVARHQLPVETMSRESMREAIVEPARRNEWLIQEGLDEQILDDVSDEPSALPFLSHALHETWERRRANVLTLQGYRDAGGVKGAIENTAESVWQTLKRDNTKQAIVRDIFLGLTELGEIDNEGVRIPDTRRRMKQSELRSDAVSMTAFNEVLDILARRRLITLDGEYVEVAHEVIIRAWKRLQGWLEDDREDLRIHRRLTQATTTWDNNKRDNSDLLHGRRLIEIEKWLQERKVPLRKLEREFVEHSLQERQRIEEERQKARRRLVLFGLIAALAVISALVITVIIQNNANRDIQAEANARATAVVIASENEQIAATRAAEAVSAQATAEAEAIERATAEAIAVAEAERANAAQATAEAEQVRADYEAAIARSRELAALSSEMLERDPVASLILAMQSINVTYNIGGTTIFETRNALFNALNAPLIQGKLAGHLGWVQTAFFNRDGSQIVTASEDGSVRLWDIYGNPISTFGDFIEDVSDVQCLLYIEAQAEAFLGESNTLSLFQRPEYSYCYSNNINSVDISPDGSLIVVASNEDQMRLWNVKNNETGAFLYGHISWVNWSAFSHDGSKIISASGDRTARLWDLNGNTIAILEGHKDVVQYAAFNHNDSQIVTTSSDRTAKVWDGNNGKLIATLQGHMGPVTHALFSPDSLQIATSSEDGTAKIWDTNGNLILELSGHTDTVNTAVFSQDGTWILTASDDNTAKLWDDNGLLITTLVGHSGRVNTANFNHDNTRIVTASSDETARLWDSKGNLLAVLDGHTESVKTAVFNYDSTRIVTASLDGTARLWDGEGSSISVFNGHTARVLSVAFHPDNEHIVTGSDDGTARLWDIHGNSIRILDGHTGAISSVAISSDGTLIVTASSDSTARLWNREGNLIAVLEGHTGGIWFASFSRDSSFVITAGADNTARIWDRQGHFVSTLEGHMKGVRMAIFSPDGSRIVTISNDKTARIWNMEGQLIAILEEHEAILNSVAFSPDGSRIITAGHDGTARLWDVNGTPVAILEGHELQVWSAKFNHDGSRVITTSTDGDVRLWDANGNLIALLRGHTDFATSAIFSHQDNQILTTSFDGTARLWDANGNPIAILEGHRDQVWSAVFDKADEWIVTVSSDGTARLWRNYPNLQAMMREAEQRLQALGLAVEN